MLWLLAAMILLTGSVWSRLAYWQVVKHDYLQSRALGQHTQRVDLAATRGRIYDSNLQPLAVDTTVYSVALFADQVPAADRERVATGLSGVLGLPRESVMGLLLSGRQFDYVAHRQSQTRADQLRALHLKGVGLVPEEQRSYMPGAGPESTLAANLLGFVDQDGRGRYGVEDFYNPRLAGKPGYVFTYQDLYGNQIVLGNQRRRDPVNGADLQLTIDGAIQQTAERAIADGVRAAKAESGSVLIMDSHTGALVAWADYPTYNANDFGKTDLARFVDPALSHIYEPGSVMKVVTLAGSMDAGAMNPNTVINDPGVIRVGGYPIRDWDNQSHGNVTMTNVLEKSLNVGAIRAMQMEGGPSFYRYLHAFGVGSPSGVDVAGEDPNALKLRPYPEWRDSELATAAFGQGVQVNMMQMLAAINVVANGGRYVRPYVVDKVAGADNPALDHQQTQVIRPETAQQMTEMMKSVVQRGSGYKARVPGFEANQAGKTGTSQIPEAGGYSSDHVWASYTGFLPADNPRFTMLVVVRKPNNGSFDHNEGYYVSAPIWKQVAQDIVDRWRITPR